MIRIVIDRDDDHPGRVIVNAHEDARLIGNINEWLRSPTLPLYLGTTLRIQIERQPDGTMAYVVYDGLVETDKLTMDTFRLEPGCARAVLYLGRAIGDDRKGGQE